MASANRKEGSFERFIASGSDGAASFWVSWAARYFFDRTAEQRRSEALPIKAAKYIFHGLTGAAGMIHLSREVKEAVGNFVATHEQPQATPTATSNSWVEGVGAFLKKEGPWMLGGAAAGVGAHKLLELTTLHENALSEAQREAEVVKTYFMTQEGVDTTVVRADGKEVQVKESQKTAVVYADKIIAEQAVTVEQKQRVQEVTGKLITIFADPQKQSVQDALVMYADDVYEQSIFPRETRETAELLVRESVDETIARAHSRLQDLREDFDRFSNSRVGKVAHGILGVLAPQVKLLERGQAVLQELGKGVAHVKGKREQTMEETVSALQDQFKSVIKDAADHNLTEEQRALIITEFGELGISPEVFAASIVRVAPERATAIVRLTSVLDRFQNDATVISPSKTRRAA